MYRNAVIVRAQVAHIMQRWPYQVFLHRMVVHQSRLAVQTQLNMI